MLVKDMTDKKRTEYLKSIKNGKLKLILDVLNDQDVKIATIKPIKTDDVYLGSEIIDFITKWRKFYKNNFFTQFKVTNERTFNWLQNIIMKSDNRIFFIIRDNDDRIICHIGVIFYNKSICELDNLAKDINCKIPGVITFVEKKLIEWLFKEMNIKKITGRLFSDNIKARTLHKRCGFKEIKEVKLSQTNRKILIVELKPGDIKTKTNHH